MNSYLASPANPKGMPTWADGIGSTLLMGAAIGLTKGAHPVLTPSQLTDAVSYVMGLAAIGWMAINALPNKQAPIAFLMGLVRRAPAANQAQWNLSVGQVEAIADAVAIKLIGAQAHKLPIVGGIVAQAGDAVAEKEIAAEGQQLEADVSAPQPQTTGDSP
jgi:hypothetical protein